MSKKTTKVQEKLKYSKCTSGNTMPFPDQDQMKGMDVCLHIDNYLVERG